MRKPITWALFKALVTEMSESVAILLLGEASSTSV